MLLDIRCKVKGTMTYQGLGKLALHIGHGTNDTCIFSDDQNVDVTNMSFAHTFNFSCAKHKKSMLGNQNKVQEDLAAATVTKTEQKFVTVSASPKSTSA